MRGKNGIIILLLGSSLGMLFLPCEAASPISNVALPVSEDLFVLREQIGALQASDDPSPLDRRLSAWSMRTTLGYGITRDWTVFGSAPYVFKRLNVDTPMGRKTRRAEGPGDLSLLFRYTAFEKNTKGGTMRAAPLFGATFPTGFHDERDALGRLPQPLQPGSGAFTPRGGAVFTWQTLGWELDLTALFARPFEGDNFRFGETLKFNQSFQYRILPWKMKDLDDEHPRFLYVTLDSLIRWQGQNTVSGRRDGDSGGVSWTLAPGLQYVTTRWVVEGAIELPAVQALNGNALKNDFRITVGFRFNF